MKNKQNISTVSTTANMYKAAARTEFISQGGYDGRFMNKTMKDKKKHENKREARDWKQNSRMFY